MRDKDRRSVEEHESESDVEMNAFFYPPRSTALKPFHNFLFPFRSKLGYIQNMCIYLHAQLIFVVDPCKSVRVHLKACMCVS